MSLPLGFALHYRRRAMHLAQKISRRKVMPWIKPEQEERRRAEKLHTSRECAKPGA
jgi:hypothetical protein